MSRTKRRGPLQSVQGSPTREVGVLLSALLISVCLASLGVAINFHRRLGTFFEPHARMPWVQFLTLFLMAWVAALLLLAYSRWRRVAIRNQELEDIVSSISPDVLLIVDAERNILMANAAVTRMFGHEIEEVLGRKTDVLYSDRRSSPGSGREVYEALEREGFHVGAAQGVRKSGAPFPLEIITGIMRRHGGGVLLLRDITERRQAEENLAQSQQRIRQMEKMEAVGRLAGGMAHDFNNYLTSIIGFGRLALESLGPNDPARTDVEEAVRNAERAAEMTGQMLMFSRGRNLERRPVNVPELITELGPRLRQTLGRDIALRLGPQAPDGTIQADRSALERILMNLVRNAADAMPQGGELCLTTERVQLSAGDCTAFPDATPGGHLVIRVRDTGCGMTSDVRAHLFEPFFTTKRSKGSGLGLTTVYGLVRQFRGLVDVESEPGVGTEVRVYFPVPAVAVSTPEGGGRG
jgi:PAS domain S-box-containing protein